MKEENYSYIGFACFFFFIVIIVMVGSFILYRNNSVKLDDENATQININEKIKEDKTKELVYYTLEESASETLNLNYKKANININSDDAKTVNEELNKIYDEALSSIKKSNNTELICESGSDIYSAISLDYAVYNYEDYITLLVAENNYSCSDGVFKPYKLHAYTFNINNGNIVSDEELITKYGLTYTKILEKIESHLNSQQTVIDGIENINIGETLNKLKANETYAIYISETKKLVVKYIVKTNSVDYNDIIELN